MNYLAHAYLSFQDPEILVGNMISDFVKGRKKFDYPEGVQRGIFIHREIDAFTDAHPATQEAKQIFRPHYRLYAAAFTDVVYDHFLANDEIHFTDNTLHQFAGSTYHTLSQHQQHFPDRFAMMFPYMQEQNWLYHYRSAWGMEKSLGGVVRRAKYLEESATAYRLFHEHYQTLQSCYDALFPDLHSMVIGLMKQ